MGLFNEDTMIFPKETAWFGFYQSDGKTIQNMEDSDEYNNDVLGLKSLNNQGKIKKVLFQGNHLQWTQQEFNQYIMPYL